MYNYCWICRIKWVLLYLCELFSVQLKLNLQESGWIKVVIMAFTWYRSQSCKKNGIKKKTEWNHTVYFHLYDSSRDLVWEEVERPWEESCGSKVRLYRTNPAVVATELRGGVRGSACIAVCGGGSRGVVVGAMADCFTSAFICIQ